MSEQSSGEASVLYDQLQAEVGVASWDALSPHAERGALFWVAGALDLVEVGVALALDQATSVQGWLEAGSLLLASHSGPRDFSAFRFLIVQPFVIATPLELPAAIEPDDA